MVSVSFDVSPADANLIARIVDRAEALSEDLTGEGIDRLCLEMDLTAAHANGCPLRLADLLAADNFNFSHDVFGIGNHINRDTGEVEHFLPRFHALDEAA